MEALLPSWLSKAAPIQSKATAMGVNASSQFLGAFFGGVTGGQLLLLNNTALGWSILTGLAIVWLLISFGLAQPRYLSSMVLRLPEHKQTDEWTSQLLAIRGIEEVVVMSDQQVAYVKVDKQQIDDATRQDLTQLSPLLDNYNKLINSYEVGLGKKDKPDPSMFELGAMR